MTMPVAFALAVPAAPAPAASAGRSAPAGNGFSDLLDGRQTARQVAARGQGSAAQAEDAGAAPGHKHESDTHTDAGAASKAAHEGNDTKADRSRRESGHHDDDAAAAVAPAWLQHALLGHAAAGRRDGGHGAEGADTETKGTAAAGESAKQTGRTDAATLLKQAAANASAASSAAAAEPSADRTGDAAAFRVGIADGDPDHAAARPGTRLEAMVAERISPAVSAASASGTEAKGDAAHRPTPDGSADPSADGSLADDVEIGSLGADATTDPKAKAGRHAGQGDGTAEHGHSGNPSGPAGKPERAAVHAATTMEAGVAQAGVTQAAAPSAQQALPGGPAAANSISFLSAIDASEGWSRYLQRSAAVTAAAGTGTALPVQALKIELHPAGLGTVTAHLHATGEQLQIEVEVRTDEAHRRLSADSDTILKSLRAAGFDAGSLVIRHVAGQPGAAGTAVGSQPGQDSGGAGQFSASAGSGRDGGSAGGQRNMGYGHGSEADQMAGRPGRDPERGGSGVYI